ncbi:hypothetical protein [Streptomyces sp. NPDC050704]|uniref:hypothetical protein n=1 Tax=Streptomyces sp. NPDC050704 TaxID=3157219 RepID=UPI003428ABAA
MRVARVTLMPLISAPPHREGVTDVAPRLRTLRTAGLLLILAAGPAHTSYAASYATPYAPSYAVEPAPAESRAGSRAGEGRERPGREAAQPENTAATHPDSPASPDRPEADAAPEPSRTTASRPALPAVEAERAAGRPVVTSEPVLRVLPLGSGLVLIGLGLGLAFLALRVRRS